MSSIGAIGNSLSSYMSLTKSDVDSTNPNASQAPDSSASSASAAAPATTPKPSKDITVIAKPSGATTKSFADVTVDARAALSANEAKMKESGHVLGMGENQGTQADVDSAFAGLDRRSLYAIASNSGGKFSQDEQTFAQVAMGQQQTTAMGLDNPSAFISDPTAGFLAGIKFLDSVSTEEKSSDNWRANRAALQADYQSEVSQHPGTKAENVDSGDPVVNMLANAIKNAAGTKYSFVSDGYITDLSKLSFFSDSKNASALQQARNQIAQTGSQSRIDLFV